MADALTDLTTLDAAKAYFAAAGVTPPADGALAALITAVSAEIGAYLGKKLVVQPHVAKLSGRGTDAIMLPNAPIISVASVSIDNQDVPASGNVSQSGYVFDGSMIALRGYRFERGVMNVLINYTAGFDPIPADIVRAVHDALLVCAARFGGDIPAGAVRVKEGDTEIDFGAISIAAKLCFSPAVTSALGPHRRVAPC